VNFSKLDVHLIRDVAVQLVPIVLLAAQPMPARFFQLATWKPTNPPAICQQNANMTFGILSLSAKKGESEGEGEVIITRILNSGYAYALHADLVITASCSGRINIPRVGT